MSENSKSGVEIRLLGRFEVYVDGVLVDERRWVRRKARTLLKILALAPRRELHREQLIELLWPDVDVEQGLNSFHKTVHATRRALEPQLPSGAASAYLITSESQISLASSVMIDVERFETQAQQALRSQEHGALEAAIALYPGDLLDEDRYENWVVLRREQLRLLAEKVLDRLASVEETSGDLEAASQRLRRLTSSSPLNEDAQRRLIRTLALLGRRDLALQQFKACADALQSELGTQPEPATVQIFEAVRSGAIGPASRPPASSPIAPPTVEQPPPRRSFLKLGLGIGTAALASGAVWFWFRPEETPVDSLAVLPVAFEGDGPDASYLADGLTDGLINSLSQIPKLRVMARSTVFRYRRKSTDPREAGRELRVYAVLTGSVAQYPTEIVVEEELVRTSDGIRLWGKRFSFAPQQLKNWQQLVLPEIAAALKQQLSPEQTKGLSAGDNSTPEAYREYLLGRLYANKRTGEALRAAVSHFERAISLSPNYALAWAGLADAHGLLGFDTASPLEQATPARDAARKAIALDNRLAEAHTSLAMVNALYEWNWKTAEQEFLKAIECNPGYVTAHHWYGVHLAGMGRFDEAKAQLQQAVALDPLSPIVNLNLGYPAFYQHHYDEALTAYRRVLEIEPDFALAYEDLATLYDCHGMYDDAVKSATRYLGLTGRNDLAVAVASDFRRKGYPAAMRTWFEASTKSYSEPTTLATLALRAGHREKCLGFLEQAREEHHAPLVYINVNPAFDAVRNEPRFRKIIQDMGLREK